MRATTCGSCAVNVSVTSTVASGATGVDSGNDSTVSSGPTKVARGRSSSPPMRIDVTSIHPQPSSWAWKPRWLPRDEVMNSVVSFLKPFRYRWNGSSATAVPPRFFQVSVWVASIRWVVAS